MRRRKETVLMVVIFATLITVGLILSCGDDESGGVLCQDACEKLIVECEILILPSMDNVENCVAMCKEGMIKNYSQAMEAYGCFLDIPCNDISEVCLTCGGTCLTLDDCGLFPINDIDGLKNLEECYDMCKEGEYDEELISCITINIHNCSDIVENCL